MKTLSAVAVVAAVYFAAGKLGLSVAALHQNVSFVWPPAGFALAVLLLGGYRLFPGVFLGALLVNALTEVRWSTALFIAFGNTLEAVLGAFLLRRALGFQNAMDRLRDALGLVVLGGMIGPTVAASIGVTSLGLEGSAAWTSFRELWIEWWVGDMLGVLVLAPFLLTWSEARHLPSEIRKSPGKALEAVSLFALLFVVAQVVFGGWIAPRIAFHPHSYLLFPFLIWAAIRFGPKGATAATLVVSSSAVWGTVHGFGPFTGQTPYGDLLFLQLFMATVVLTMLALAATIAERKRSEAVKSEFASMVSHELRTPLSSIKAGIEVVLDGIDGPITPEQRETLGIAKNNVARLTRLINNVLDYSKLESGRMEIVFERTDMCRLVRETGDLMNLAMQDKGINFWQEVPGQTLFAVCDGDKIRQVVINLLDNAVKFTDAGGTVVLRLSKDSSEISIEVEDTGIGIKKEDQERIFEMFGQVSPIGQAIGRASKRGSGVGLAVCRLIVAHHKGRIRIESRPGRGTRLTVSFPDSLPEKKKAVLLK